MFIARRLRLTPGDGVKRSPAIAIAIGGVALAITVMMISIAVVFGFQEAVRNKVAGFEAPISLKPLGRYYQGEANIVNFNQPMREAVSEALPGAESSLVISQPAVLRTPGYFAGVVIRGYGQGHDYAFESENLIKGHLPGEKYEITVSLSIASKLSVDVGDKIEGCFFVNDALKLRRLTVSGIYTSNFSDYDNLTVYGNFEMLAALRGLADGEGDMVELRGLVTDEIKVSSERLQQSLAKRYEDGRLTSGVNVVTLFDSGAMYFNWLELLDMNIVVILVIMSLISGFTLISCVFILILQRVRMIGVLKSLGASDGSVRRVFILLGSRVVSIGLAIGNLSGISLLLLQMRFHIISLDPDAYFLDYVPVTLDWQAFLLLNAGAVILAAALMLIPTSIISRISPAMTMNFE